jgi:hypothetical protein
VTDTSSTTLSEIVNFLSSIFAGCTGQIEIRIVLPDRQIRQRFFKDPMEAAKYALSWIGRANIYYGVGSRMRRKGTKADVLEIVGFYADCDTPESVIKVHEFPFKPTFIIETSAGRCQAIWQFVQPLLIEHEGTIAMVEGVLKAIAKALASDASCAEVARVLRLPGTINIKDNKSESCRLLHADGPRYEPEDFISAGYFIELSGGSTNGSWESSSSRSWRSSSSRELSKDGPYRRIVDLVASFWGNEIRHKAALPLAGGLLGDGFIENDVKRLLIDVAAATDDKELHDRLRAVADTAARIASGQRVQGWGTLARLVGPDLVGRLKDLLGLGATNSASSAQSANSANSANEGSGGEGWEPPIPFHEFDLPPFPTDALPEPLRRLVEAEAEATQTPLDLAAMLVLSACAAAVARKFVVQVKDGYREPLNIFTVTALPPGSRKSSVFSDVTAPLTEFEKTETERLAPHVAAARTRLKVAEVALRRAEKKAGEAQPDKKPLLLEEAERLARELAGMPPAVPPRFLADDTTPERLATLLHEQDGRMAVLSPEGGIFDLMAGRYSQDGTPNFEVYLRGHAGDTLRVDRVGRTPEHVDRPALTLGLAVQPIVLDGLASKTGFRGRGLLARFLYAVPKSLIGRRKIDPPAVPAEIREEYRRYVLGLLRLTPDHDEHGQAKEHVLHLEGAARTTLDAFAAEIEPRLPEFGDLGPIADWGAKLVGATARLAGVLHLAEHGASARPESLPMQSATVGCAIQIGRYLIPHARAAFATMGADPGVEQAKHILRWILHRGVAAFSKRDLFEGTKGRFKTTDALDKPLALLCSHHYIRQAEVEPRVGPGRPRSQRYEVNPLWLSQNSQNSQNAEPADDLANSANYATPDEELGPTASPDPDPAATPDSDVQSGPEGE